VLDVSVGGEASGRCRFELESGRIDALGELELEKVTIDRHAVGSGSGRLKVAAGRAEAALDIASAGSRIELAGDAGVTWSDSGPTLDALGNGAVRVTARSFELAVLQPFLRDTFTRLGGKLNGHLELGWRADSAQRLVNTLRANAAIEDGMASLTAGGGLIQKVDLQARAEGNGPLALKFSGAARARKPNVEGTALVRLEGPRLKRFDAELELDGFPLIYDGVLMGRATSGARAPLAISIVSEREGQTIDVHVPAVAISLPKSSDKTLIALGDDASIAIADAPLDPETRRRAAKSSGSTTLKLRLGKKVRIERGGLEVPVTGAVNVLPDGRLNGAIELPPGGVVPALGQIFRIRRGTVSFRSSDAKAGTLAIQAWTRVADGTLIDVDVSGTVVEPVIAFRSDPPRSEDEIVALLLGIQNDNETSDESEQLGRTAMALAMNRLVADSALSGLQFGAGETSTGDSVSTVTMRVGSKVWVEGRSVHGSQTSVNQGERTSGVVDWRFAPSWSLRTQLGDVSGVELRWSLRY
jgi:autotransporter translocation and assembly factor TamB